MDSTLDDFERIVEWFHEKIVIPQFSKEKWKIENTLAIKQFTSQSNGGGLFVYFVDTHSLYVGPSVPNTEVTCMYFVKNDGIQLTFANLETNVRFGTLCGNRMQSLWRVMNGVYMKRLSKIHSWPENTYKEFTSQFYRFMAGLTEVVNHAKGKTVLYLPPIEVQKMNPNDKDIVQQLESTVIHWTRQIKEVVNNQDNAHDAEGAGPLEEIQFWEYRTQDLSGITEQLERQGVKDIVQLLRIAKSSYLKPFETLSEIIMYGSLEANDNLRFLNKLAPVCQQLSTAATTEIPSLLPTVLHYVRLIWTYSKFYNTEDRITSLLRKISNEIIRCCCVRISLENIFNGNIDGSVAILEQSIECGVAWKKVYYMTVEAVASNPTTTTYNNNDNDNNTPRKWSFDETSIFAQVDAFVQRCRDLLEICEGQVQFARRSGQGEKRLLPNFGGNRGQEIIKSLLGIENQFEGQIDRLRRLEYDILDVKITHWHGDFNTFKNGVKDLEAMTQNVIHSAFDGISTISGGADLLMTFQAIAQREAIVRCIEKKTCDIFTMFKSQVAVIRITFEKNKGNPPLSVTEPQFAGAALWARSLLLRIQKDWDRLLEMWFLPCVLEKEDSKIAFEGLKVVIHDYIQKKFHDWMEKVSSLGHGNLTHRLDTPLMTKSGAVVESTSQQHHHSQHSYHQGKLSSKRGLLECNFDRPLLQLFAEVHYWQFFNGEVQIPYVAHDLCNQKEQLRILREHVLLVVRDYNRIVQELSLSERRLFEDIIRRLDRRIQPGLHKLTWVSKGIVEWYVTDCRQHCDEIYQIVHEFKVYKEIIHKQCKTISQLMLISIERNNVYDEYVFEAMQKEHRNKIQNTLKDIYDTIHSTMNAIHHHFANGPLEVKREWMRFVERADKALEDSLRQAVKRSLQELAKAINGDAKTEPHPLFRVHVILEENKVEFRPLMSHLTQMVNTIAKEVFQVIGVVSRLNATLHATDIKQQLSPKSSSESNTLNISETTNMNMNDDDPSTSINTSISTTTFPEVAFSSDASASTTTLPEVASSSSTLPLSSSTNLSNFYQSILKDEEINKVLVQIMNGMTASGTELQKYIAYWDKYKILWSTDKQAFVRRYAKANRPLSQLRIDIERYREQQVSIQNEDLTNTINFIQIDTSLLKASLVVHTVQWVGKLTGLLNSSALEELTEIRDMIKKNTEILAVKPLNLDHLGENIRLLQTIQEEAPLIEQRLEPLEQKYSLLNEFDVQVAEEEIKDLNQLRPSWERYKEVMIEAQAMLQKCKVNMKQNVQKTVDQLNTHMTHLRTEALATLPYSTEMTSAEAHLCLQEFEKKMKATRQSQEALRKGLEIFGIQQERNEGYYETEKELELLTSIWNLADEWETLWCSWKTMTFRELDVDQMESTSEHYHKVVMTLGREIKKWKIWETMKVKIDQFQLTLPLIQDLKSPALRPRHWNLLKEEMGKGFDAFSNHFTLEKVFSLGFHQHANYINQLSANANKEFSIEIALESIQSKWSTLIIEMCEYKIIYHKVKKVDDLFVSLEDDQVQLSTIKASPFYLTFEKEVLYWEKSISHISEVVETLLSVQKCWMYMESIFMTSEDIQRQLPLESKLFDEVNQSYKHVTESIVREPNALKVCNQEGILESLFAMEEKLDTIQKCLDQYLETKRTFFPRFYFLSNDDLLEILGHQKEPEQVQKHIKKCFEGIQTLHLILSPIAIGNTASTNASSNASTTAAKGHHQGSTWVALGMNAPDGEQILFETPVVVSGAVEGWLLKTEQQMIATLKKIYVSCLLGYKGKKEKWIREYPGQLLITCGQTAWTTECSKALMETVKGEKLSLKQLKKKWVSYLNKLADMVRGQLSLLDRKKVVALITIEIHARDVIERLIKQGCQSVNDFDWLMQLRYYYIKDENININPLLKEITNTTSTATTTTTTKEGIGSDNYGSCEIKQTVTTLSYSYEYQGNNGRLVITPLTDRCVLTMTTALHLNRGGNPLGPAGTGKTETVKDLGKNLAKYVIVFNCSDGLDYKSVGRMFSGLVQSGGWGCFDEFNRIEIEVLSVVAQQVLTIMQALSAKSSEFMFLGSTIKCNRNMGIFITMNPGYAGRTELPDNLKALMRPCAMMVPDLALITEVMLQAEGFREARLLAKKTTSLYGLMQQQLSKQDHYDFGLRSLKAVLNMAGALTREDPDLHEEFILLRALRDMNLPKFIKEDAVLFHQLLGDLFPNIELSVSEYGKFQTTIEDEMIKEGLQKHATILLKTIQLYESQQTRHCNMLVGKTMAGKSTVWKLLQASKTTMAKSISSSQINNNNNNNSNPGTAITNTTSSSSSSNSSFMPVRIQVLNPKSISLNEIYGVYDLSTFEWVDGILSALFRQFAAPDTKKEEKWILLDGPVDTLWIESMNSVMDDNKVLTLINGDRISMSSSMSLVFEVQDLTVASPATVSRAGMVYMDVDDLGYQPYVASWLARAFPEESQEFVASLFQKYVEPLLKYKSTNVEELIPLTDFNCVQSLCNLFKAIVDSEMGNDSSSNLGDLYFPVMEKLFLFAMTWSLMAGVTQEGRKKMDVFVRDIDTLYPPIQTMYEFFVDMKSKEFKLWDEKLNASYRIPPHLHFSKVMVPTIDTLRYGYLCQTLIQAGIHTLMVGATGVGKTMTIQKEMDHFITQGSMMGLVMNFSSATTAQTTQSIIESILEKKSMNRFGPPGGKKSLIFLDDLNLPKKDEFGSQPPLELLRQWIDYGYWYDRSKQTLKYIVDMQLIGAMGPPGGGRSVISSRLLSRFHVIHMTMPSVSQLRRIFETMLNPKFSEYDEEIRPLSVPLVSSTIQLYNVVEEAFLPTPEKCHYLFNLRDMSKVIHGFLRSEKNGFTSRESVLRLWVHECNRVFSDRLVSKEDRLKFDNEMDIILRSQFQMERNRLLLSTTKHCGPLFCTFLSSAENPTYDEIADFSKLKTFLEEKLEDYNLEARKVPLNLVMFQDAILHTLRIHRVLSSPRGNLMLVGIGGSGRQSLTKLASYIISYQVFVIEMTKNYRHVEFHNDLKKLFELTGIQRKPTVFLFNDIQVKDESFLEDISNILSSGKVPNLYTKDEQVMIIETLRSTAKSEGIENSDQIWNFFINEVRQNTHVVLAMSPIGSSFRNRCRQYPSFINCTTIDWFEEWPDEALQDVSMKLLEHEERIPQQMKPKIASVFSSTHISVSFASSRMLQTLKRYNYVTPTNFLALVKGYLLLLKEKSLEMKESRDKLGNGLAKLDESRKQVEEMSKQLEERKVIASQKNKDCSDLLVVIVSERRVADEQRKYVEADSERICKEEAETQRIADDAQRDLDEALPALQQAMLEVDKLDKNAISEIKAYTKPPEVVAMVMSAVMTLFGLATDWATAKKKVSETNFLQQIKTFDKDGIRDKTVSALKKFTSKSEFSSEYVVRVSVAAGALCSWVLAMEVYSTVYRQVAPKREILKKSQDALSLKQVALIEAKEKLRLVTEKVETLKKQYDDSVNEKNALREEAEILEIKLTRAQQLVTGLSGERERWEVSISKKDESLAHVIGDVLLAAAFLSYAGPFDTQYRSGLIKEWLSKIELQQIPVSSEHFKFTDFLSNPTDVREWNIQGLPRDSFSTENGVIVSRGTRWPLMIDPQGQANKWIRAMEKDHLHIVNPSTKDYLREIENAIKFGNPILMEDILEELDPSLEPILNKSVMKIGSRHVLKLGDKELDYNFDFKLYLTTKLHNPHYTPEISTKTTIVNFEVKEKGLEAQLLGIVVQMEEPTLEHQKSQLVLRVAAAKKKLLDLENEILRLLSSVQGSLLDDQSLVETLNASKVTSEEVTVQLHVSEETEKKIDEARMGYASVSLRSSVLYFVLNDMSSVDPMYQFSLDAYVQLFQQSIEKSRHLRSQLTDGLNERILAINNYHTHAVYSYACLGLFERHKLLFSLQMCFKLLQSTGKLVLEEYNYLLKGGIVLHRERLNPGPDFLDDLTWDNVCELDKLVRFQGLISSFEQSLRAWKVWYTSNTPETEILPGDWEAKCNDLQRMLLLRALRPDRIANQATRFISNTLGSQFVDPPSFDLEKVYSTSTCTTPLIFILSPGVDPTNSLLALATSLKKKVENCALGQGQAPIATDIVQRGIQQGNWVFLANCHLMLSWAPTLEKIIDEIALTAISTSTTSTTTSIPNSSLNQVHVDFRLWLSSNPTPLFPISILQRAIKMTTEPPRGIKANFLRLYNTITEEKFNACQQSKKYKKLLFCLCWFHSLLIERRKFHSLGWNIPYDFNESDFSISENVLAIYLDEYEETPWDALKYLIAQANYGGRVTDEWDRRLISVYISQFFCDQVLTDSNFMLSDSEFYSIPNDGNYMSYKDTIKRFPMEDPPSAFGQHANAQIASQIEEAKSMLQTILSLQPLDVFQEGCTNEEKVMSAIETLEKGIPQIIDLQMAKDTMSLRSDPEPLKTVFLQEVERYNGLLTCIHRSLYDLKRGIQGFIIITTELEAIFQALLLGKVPKSWSFCYPSLKPLGTWTKDLQLRIEQLVKWETESLPNVFWLSGFTYPTGFLTSLLQTAARKTGVAIDSLNWEFLIVNQQHEALTSPPKEGAYIKGLYLVGAKWDFNHDCLAEANPMELTCAMPIIHFKPVESKKRTCKGIYSCPLYIYPIRTGTRERPSFMIAVDLKCGQHKTPELWTKRGTALLLSLA